MVMCQSACLEWVQLGFNAKYAGTALPSWQISRLDIHHHHQKDQGKVDVSAKGLKELSDAGGSAVPEQEQDLDRLASSN